MFGYALNVLHVRRNLVLDNLERRGLVERRPNPEDRRLYSLHLTGNGGELLGRIGKVAREHQDALLAALSAEERTELAGLLQKVADECVRQCPTGALVTIKERR